MPVRIYVDKSATEARITGAWNQGLADLSEEILADCNEFCKERSHALIDSSLIHSKPKIGKLVWQTEYAKRQYWEIQTSLKPGRFWKWCEYAKNKCKTRWAKKGQERLREHL